MAMCRHHVACNTCIYYHLGMRILPCSLGEIVV